MHSQWIQSALGQQHMTNRIMTWRRREHECIRVADPLAFIRSLRSARMRHVASETQRCGSPIKIASRSRKLSVAFSHWSRLVRVRWLTWQSIRMIPRCSSLFFFSLSRSLAIRDALLSELTFARAESLRIWELALHVRAAYSAMHVPRARA